MSSACFERYTAAGRTVDRTADTTSTGWSVSGHRGAGARLVALIRWLACGPIAGEDPAADGEAARKRWPGEAAGAHPYRPERDLDRGACGDGSALPAPSARAALAAIPSITRDQMARGRSCPMPSMLISFAPGISASRRAPARVGHEPVGPAVDDERRRGDRAQFRGAVARGDDRRELPAEGPSGSWSRS